jgi:hypothetical protein
MADEYYTIAQAAKKLGKTEDEIKAMAKDGDLIGMKNGSEVVFDKKEIDALADAGDSGEADDSIFSITDDTLADTNLSGQTDIDEFGNVSENEMSSILGLADTMNVNGDSLAESTVDPLEGLDADAKDTHVGENTNFDLAGDANLESAESGSGVLDLSIQADDTSFGAVLDDIMPGDEANQAEGLDDFAFDEPEQSEKPAGEPELAAGEPVDQEDQSSDLQKELTREAVAFSAPAPAAAAGAQTAEDATSGAYGAMLLLPVIGVAIAAIAVSAAVSGVTPGIFDMLQKYIWYVVIALAVLSLALLGISAMMSSSGNKPKTAKAKKEKKKKEKKPKKAKK